MRLSVGGITVAVASAAPDLVPATSAACAPFRGDAGATPDLALIARWADLSHETGTADFDSGGVWTLTGRRYRFLAGGKPYRALELDPDETTGTVWLDRAFYEAGEVDPLEYPADELIFNRLLARRDGALFHGCGIVARDGTGTLAVAHSGGGKSTLARLVHAHGAGAVVLSDERILVRREAAGFRMWGTPWLGEGGFSVNASAPVSRILLLEHAGRNTVGEVGPAAAAAQLFACAYPPFHDAALSSRVLETAAALASAVTARSFGFLPEASAVALLAELGYA